MTDFNYSLFTSRTASADDVLSVRRSPLCPPDSCQHPLMTLLMLRLGVSATVGTVLLAPAAAASAAAAAAALPGVSDCVANPAAAVTPPSSTLRLDGASDASTARQRHLIALLAVCVAVASAIVGQLRGMHNSRSAEIGKNAATGAGDAERAQREMTEWL